jgi:hypothetical protein
MADEYAGWVKTVKTRTPPLFGSHSDAKVVDLASSLRDAFEPPRTASADELELSFPSRRLRNGRMRVR